MHIQKPIRRRTPSCCQTLLIMRIKEMLLRSKCETFSALSLPFKNFPGDVSAQIIIIKQPAQAAGLADLSNSQLKGELIFGVFCNKLIKKIHPFFDIYLQLLNRMITALFNQHVDF